MLPLSTHITFGLQLDSNKFYLKGLAIEITFLSLTGTTHAYLLKISMTHNKNQKHLLCLLINCISVKSAPKVLSLKGEFIFRFSIILKKILKFLIIGFGNSSANCWFGIISLLAVPPEYFLEKIISNWSKSVLTSFITWIFCNIKCFIM